MMNEVAPVSPLPARAAAPSLVGTAEGLDARLVAVLRSFVRSSVSFGRSPAESFERVARAFCARLVNRSIDAPLPIGDLAELQAAMSQKSALPFDTTGAAIVTKAVLARIGPTRRMST